MGRLKTLQRDIRPMPSRLQSNTTAEHRVKGRALQSIRLDHWKKNPHCAMCGQITAYPYGFELDHIVPLYQGGADADNNRQILCNGPDGCHLKKTAKDMGITFKQAAGSDGWPQ